MGKSPDIEKVSDKEQFKETIQAMRVLGFDTRQVRYVVIYYKFLQVCFFKIIFFIDFRCFKYSCRYTPFRKYQILP